MVLNHYFIAGSICQIISSIKSFAKSRVNYENGFGGISLEWLGSRFSSIGRLFAHPSARIPIIKSSFQPTLLAP